MKSKKKREIIFKATVYRDAVHPMTGEISKEPYSVTLYSDCSIVSRWCGSIESRRTLVLGRTDDPETLVIGQFKKYLADEIKKLEGLE